MPRTHPLHDLLTPLKIVHFHIKSITYDGKNKINNKKPTLVKWEKIKMQFQSTEIVNFRVTKFYHTLNRAENLRASFCNVTLSIKNFRCL